MVPVGLGFSMNIAPGVRIRARAAACRPGSCLARRGFMWELRELGCVGIAVAPYSVHAGPPRFLICAVDDCG